MSIIIKSQSGSGGSTKGYPPGDVIINYKSLFNNTLCISWIDPDNLVYNNTTLSTWAGTILIYKEGSYPTSPTDGTVVVNNTTKNAYKYTDFTCSISSNNTLYFRFYTYNTDKVYNDSSSMMFTLKNINADPVLANNSWETISEIAESGEASLIWNIGDEITFTVGPGPNSVFSRYTYTLQIWDFNHFEKTDGSGKAGILFGMKFLANSFYAINKSPYNSTNETAYSKTTMGSRYMPDAYNGLVDTNLKSVIKEVYISSQGDDTSTAYIFIPSASEICDFSPSLTLDPKDGEHGETRIPIFTDNASRYKYREADSDKATREWWTRSTTRMSNGSIGFRCADSTDNTGAEGLAIQSPTYEYGVCMCFNV